MQPDLIDSIGLGELAPGLGRVLVATVGAGFLTLFSRRAAHAAVLRRWSRWFNPIVVAAWMLVGWSAALAILAAGTGLEVVVRGALLLAVLVIATPVLRDLLAAVTISMEGHHRADDHIRIGDLEGRIVSMGLRSVILRRRDGSECVIPNLRFAAAEIVRLNLPSGEAPCEFEVSLAPGRSVEVARADLVEAALLSPFSAPGTLPEVFVVAAEDSTVRLRVRAYVFDRTYEERYRSDILAAMERATLPAPDPAVPPS
jgi:small conductance mechanosensitive channel